MAIGKRTGGEVLLTERGPVFLGTLDGVSDRLRAGQQDEPLVREQVARSPECMDRILRVAERLQEQDPVEPPTGEGRHCGQVGEVALDEFQTRRLGDEVVTDVDPDRGHRTVLHQLRNFRAVTAPGIQHGRACDVPEQAPLRGPLDQPIQRVLPGPRLLVARCEFRPRAARVATVVALVR